MGPLDVLLHLCNLLAPSLAVAAVLVLTGRWWGGGRARPRSAWARWAILAGAGSAVLLAGLWLFGRDGKMLTYGALVLVLGSGHWLMQGGGRR